MKTTSFIVVLCLLTAGSLFAQEFPSAAPMQGRISPTQLLRMRNQLTRDIQESQRVMGFIDPAETQLVALHKEQQAELLNQLKEINEQLKAQGFPIGNETAQPIGNETAQPVGNKTAQPIGNEEATRTPGNQTAPVGETALPPRPRAEDPTLIPGGTPRAPADPNLLIQRRELTPNFDGANLSPPNPEALKEAWAALQRSQPKQQWPSEVAEMPTPTPPTPFDQDQAWSESPWAVQPSKELTSVKESVESLRKEVADLKETVKDLETQIRLLNRLLSQQNAQ